MKSSLRILTFILLVNPIHAQIVIEPKDGGNQSFFGSTNEVPTVLGVNKQPVITISPDFGNIGVSTNFYTGNTLRFPTHAKVHIRTNSNSSNDGVGQGPQLLLDENDSDDYARLRFRQSKIVTTIGPKGDLTTSLTPKGRYWDIAGFGNADEVKDDKLNFFHSGYGNVMTATGQGRVGIKTTSPDADLDVNGYTKLGENSGVFKNKFVTGTSSSNCSNNQTTSIALGINASRIMAVSVLVNAGSEWYGPGDRYNNREYSYRINGSNLEFTFAAVSGCDFIIRNYRINVTYSDTVIPSI